MSETRNSARNRREFLKHAGRIATASAMAGAAIPHVHAAESNTIQVALIGCGSRGAGAAANALSNKSGPIKLVAMADVFGPRLSASYGHLNNRFAAHLDVPEDRRFVGLGAYTKAMNCLRPGDVVILATPPAFRWMHFRYAVEKALNVFMEKPVAVDGPTGRRMISLAEESEKKNLKVGVGLMLRQAPG